MKLPSSVRFFRKPDHISFLIGLAFIIIYNLVQIGIEENLWDFNYEKIN